jgi:hyperosmotically inducible protein
MNIAYKFPSLIAAVALMALTAGCQRSTPSTDVSQRDDQAPAQQASNSSVNQTTNQQAASSSMSQTANNAGVAIDDATITAKVKAALVAAPDLHAMEIKVNTEDGVVTLTGAIDNQQAIAHAAQVAQTVDGVKTINNQLSVRAAS